MSKNEEVYKKLFELDSGNMRKASLALDHALDIRKFEIDLYWKRATYFWTLIAAAFAGYFAMLGTDVSKLNESKTFLAYILSCIGLLFTWAWFLVNRGSKFWQENWENHVDMLENGIIGPLYKTILSRPVNSDYIEKLFTGPMKVSVSKINQWVSLFTLCIWAVLAYYTFPDGCLCGVATEKYIFVLFITILFCACMLWKGKTHLGQHDHAMIVRKTEIID